MLVTTLLTLFYSYQEYMVSIVRSEKNWEAEFDNIKYKNTIKIAQDDNIKDVSIYESIGTTRENLSNITDVYRCFNLSAYNQSAFENSYINLIEGRFPENSDEIIISVDGLQVLETDEEPINYLEKNLSFNINEETKKYTVVGLAEKLETDRKVLSTPFYIEVGAITYLDDKIINDDMTVNVTVITNNLHGIYDTVRNLATEVGINQKEEIKLTEEEEILKTLGLLQGENNETPCFFFNTPLLNYAGVLESGSDFAKTLYTIRSCCNTYCCNCINSCNIYVI